MIFSASSMVKAHRYLAIFAVFLGFFLVMLEPAKGEKPIIVQSTTSTRNSGLYDYLVPLYKKATGKDVRIVAVGTGQAIKNARNCDGDILLVHSKADEEAFVADGYGIKRHDLMYNDFVLIGPADDPAGVRGIIGITEALEAIADAKVKFVSRGDDSGTHKAETRFWKSTNVNPKSASGKWYIETGSGMGATLNISVQIGGYVISDRSTWLAFNNKAGHDILFEGDSRTFNQYGVIVVNPGKCKQVNVDDAKIFANWLISAEGQQAINSYEIQGQQLFFGNAK
jgi:tungstate transport system substrate-binding protein